MPWLVFDTAYWANSCVSKGMGPATFNHLLLCFEEPLKRHLPDFLALLVQVCTCCSGLGTALAFVNSKAVVISNVLHHRIDRGQLNRFEKSPKLVEEIRVMTVNCPQEEHHYQYLRDGNLAGGKLHEAIKARLILQDWFILSLNIIDNQHKGSECVQGGIWTAMLSKGSKHFKTVAIKSITLVFKNKAERPILDSQSKLPFPHPTCIQIWRISDQSIVQPTSRVFWDPKIVLDELEVINERLVIRER
jgi:hypothetical protein